ncbi:MAG: cytoplasmic protein [Bacteroidetes bacterium]|nr:MAG: cytoplasmic protein [Bacteroidota bacterium]
MFTQNDLRQFQAKGIDVKVIEQQIDNFKTGFPFVELIAPATINNGLKTFSDADADKLMLFYDKNFEDFEILKFVPASGAASRMFKTLFEFREKYGVKADAADLLENDKGFNSAYNFFTNIRKFAFFDDLRKVMEVNGLNIETCLSEKDYNSIIDFLLEDKGLGYAALPKAMLKFHSYSDGPRLAMEEHLVEGANYGQNSDGRVAVHFTVSPEHADRFIEEINKVKDKYEELFDVIYELTFSIQKSSTDTIAVDSKNKPFRNEDESIVFRPGGHGALIENLNDREGEIIFIKNIDNIVPDRLKDQTYRYKRVIGGYLIELRNKIFEFLEKLEDGNLADNDLNKIISFSKEKLFLIPGPDFEEMTQIEKVDYLYNKLNRPIRICGMVRNEGEPGGGPFWIKNTDGEVSLQIVESSQIDLVNSAQKEIFSKSTHFNPVDLVCYVRDFNNEQFDLREFVDPSTGFISVKSKDGRELKAQELPGLWNGAMADWITVFVEVPIITFNPVKTVNDLLRKEHQPA